MKKNHHSIFEYLNDKFWLEAHWNHEMMVISILFNIAIVNFFKTLHTVLIVKKQIFRIEVLDEINFFLIITYILIQNQSVYLFFPKVSMVHWHNTTSIQWSMLCVLTELLCHNASEVYTTTLKTINWYLGEPGVVMGNDRTSYGSKVQRTAHAEDLSAVWSWSLRLRPSGT